MQDLLRRMMVAFLVIGALVSVSVAVKHAVPSYAILQERRARCAELREELAQVRQQTADTKRDIERFGRSPYFVEQLARARHRVADNEVLLLFED